MAKKPSNQGNTNKGGGAIPQRPMAQKATPVQVEKKPMSAMQMHLLALLGIVVTTMLFLKISLLNQFTNWDDPGYVLNNPLIKDISSEGIKNIFSWSNPVMGNYHPLTILTYALDYAKAGLDPYHYHFQSLFFHIATTILVYCFTWLLSKRMVAAIVTAVLFGLHPMHVESVAWVAGRKDVVYGFFYIASCIAYLYYTRASGISKWLFYVGVAVLYACSLISKPVAVVLPITLLLIDYFEGRIWSTATSGAAVLQSGGTALGRLNYTTLIDKLPLLALSVMAGIKSLQDQQVFGALGTQSEKYTALERLGLGGYALITYLWKAVVPIRLLCFYPYPLKESGAMAPVYYIYPVIAAVLLFGAFWFFRTRRAVVFGVLFFLVNIALLLQFIPVGGAIIADRYTYIPYIGLFFILGWAVSTLFDNTKTMQMGKLAFGIVLAYTLVLGYMSNERCKVWYDGMSLWRDEIEVEPIRAPNGYNNLGFFYFNKFNLSVDPREKKIFYDSAFYLLNRAIELQPSFVNPYISIGELLRSSNQFDKAKIYYYKALTLDKTDQAANAYLGLAVIYSITRKDDSALFCYDRTLALKPYNPEAHSNYANFLDMTNRKEQAIKEYGVALDQNPDIFQPYLNRARAFMRIERYDEALRDLNKAAQIEPKLGEIYYFRALCYDKKGDKATAQKDLETARKLGYAPGRQ